MGKLTSYIKKYLNITEKQYIESPQLIAHDFNIEKSKIEEYAGRQFFELIQNADDAAAISAEKKHMLISFNDEKLIIANNGEPFSENSYDSLFFSNISPKVNRDLIGNKGLGFRSILSWADEITINSGGVSVRFSEEITKKFWDRIKNQDGVMYKVSQNIKKGSNKCPVAKLKIPEIMTEVVNEFPEYDTVIELSLKPNIADEVRKQLTDIMQPEALLFFNNLTEIKVINHGSETLISRQSQMTATGKKSTVSILDNTSETPRTKTWYLLEHHFEIQVDGEIKKAVITVAYTEQLDNNEEYLYSFYRTNVRFPAPIIIHASFELTPDRKYLIENETNRIIFEELAGFLCRSAERLATSGKRPLDFALRFIGIDREGCDSIVKSMGFFTALKDRLSKSKIIPTVNCDYISFEDKPVELPDPLWTYFSGNDVTHLVNGSFRESYKVVKKLLESNGFKYPIGNVLSLIHKSVKQLSPSSVVNLYLHIAQDYKDELANLPKYDSIMLNTKGDYIDTNKKVFLSLGSKIIYDLPQDIQIDFLDEGISQEIEKQKKLDTIEDAFNIHRYSFKEIATTLIDHYNDRESVEDVIAMHRSLFQAFQAAIANDESTLGVDVGSVRVIAKTGTVVTANTAYFGEEYTNKLTEIIYSEVPSKILGTPEMNGLQSIDKDHLRKYFKWLGVAGLPRLIQTSKVSDHDKFIEYVMLNYDYKRYTVGELKFYDYNDLLKREGLNSNLHSYKFTTVEELDIILKTITVETLMEWISTDEALQKMLRTDNDQEGSLNLSIGQKLNLRDVDNHCLKSYIRWKIANTPLLVDSENPTRKVTPNQCCMANTIRAEYSPDIVKPKVNFSRLSEILDVKEEEINELLSLIGVHMSIKTFSTKALYQILVNLPISDPNGNKAKVIYREILNYDEHALNVEDDVYKQFILNGKVLCRAGLRSKYIPVNEAWYLDIDRYNESIKSQFNLIDLDYKRGAKKVEALFGVKPLRKVEIKLLDEPSIHPLNGELQKFLYDAQPYVYVIVQNSDTEGAILRSLMNTKIIMVSRVRAEMTYNGKQVEIDIQPFESVYITENGHFYILVDSEMQDWESIKGEYSFKNSIAHIFASITEGDSDQMFRIVCEDKKNWNSVLKGLFDLDYIKELETARVKMKRDINEIITFWNLFASCLTDSSENVSITNNEDLNQYLYATFGEAASQPWILEHETYIGLHNQQILANLYKLIKPVCVDFNRLSRHYPQLDFRSMVRIELVEIQKKYDCVFKASLFSNLKDKDRESRTKYLDIYARYENLFKTDDVPKYVHDPEKYFMQTVYEQFGFELGIEEVLDINEIIKRNMSLWEEKISFNLNEVIRQSNKIKSLLLFGEFEAATEAAADLNEKASARSKVRVGGEEFEYKEISDINQQLDDLIQRQNPPIINRATSRIKADQSKPKPRKRSINRFNGHSKSEIGYIAEYLAYKQLVATHGVDRVDWLSENASKAGINMEGRAGRGFDISLSVNGVKRYVEVKAIKDPSVGFQMSKNELKLALQFPDRYDILIVQSITENPELVYIKSFFDIPKNQKFTKNSRFTTQLSSARIIFDLKNK